MQILAVVVCIALFPFAVSEKPLQAAEMPAAKYVIGIDTDGSLSDNEAVEAASGQQIRMTNSSGHTFDCFVPSFAQDADLQMPTNKNEPQQQDRTSEQVLNALSARCFYRLEDWWTYELCHQKHVRQFHREKDVLTSEYLLGLYEAESAETDTVKAEATESHGQYVKQTYLHGDACDLTGSTRQTEVRYTCGEGGQEAIVSMKEPSTCHYMLTVAVPGLCQLPTFHQEAEPITHITCKPVLGLTLTESSADSDSQQQQQHQDVSHDDLSDTDSELGTNTTEQE